MSSVDPPPASGREQLAVALVGAAVVALPIVTSERTALPAPLVLGVAVGAVVVAALRRAGTPRWWPDAGIAAAVGLASAVAHLVPGLLLGHDTLHHIWGSWAYLQSWAAGDLAPIWLHDLGLGMPLPMFYGPLPYWVMMPIALAGGGPAHLLAGSFALAGAAAGLTAWWAAAAWTDDRRAALVAAVAWAYSPYRLLDANHRAALGETWALALLPLVLVSFDRVLAGVEPRRRWRVGAALAIAAVTVTHPLSLLLLAVVLPVLALARWRSLFAAGTRGAAARLVAATAAGVSGLALAGFFAVPLVAELGYLNVGPLRSHAAVPKYALQGLDARLVLERRLWSAMEWARPDNQDSQNERELPFYFGLVGLAALTGAALARREEGERGMPRTALAAVGFVAFALAFRPFAQLTTSAVRELGLLQFPWRFFGPASAAAALALGGLAARFAARDASRRGALVATLLALAALADGFPYSGGVARAERWQGLVLPDGIFGTGVIRTESVPAPWPQRVFGIFLPPWSCCAAVGEVFSEFPEYVTPTARHTSTRFAVASVGLVEKAGLALQRIDALPYARLWSPGVEEPLPLDYRRRRGTITVRLPESASGRVEVAEQYFPGWQVDLAGDWTEVTPAENGLLQADLPAGARELRFRFDRWRWDRLAGWLSSLATAIWLGFEFRRRRQAVDA